MASYYLATTGNDTTGDGSSGNPWRTLGKAGSSVVAGDTVYVRATAGNALSYPTSSLDYNIASFFTPTAGTVNDGHVRWIGENGIPTIGSPGLGFYNSGQQYFEGLYFVATSNGNASFGIIHGSTLTVNNCIINLNNQVSMVGISAGGTSAIFETEIYGGTTTPSFSSGGDGIVAGGYGTKIFGCRIHHCRDNGIIGSLGTYVCKSLIIYNIGNGIKFIENSTMLGGASHNTIDSNGGHGILVSNTGGICFYLLHDNNITNHVGSGKSGISVSDGSTALNDKRKIICDYNNFYGNTSNYFGISSGPHDLLLDPQYADVATGDFTPTNELLRSAALKFWTIGAIPMEAPSGGEGGEGSSLVYYAY